MENNIEGSDKMQEISFKQILLLGIYIIFRDVPILIRGVFSFASQHTPLHGYRGLQLLCVESGGFHLDTSVMVSIPSVAVLRNPSVYQ